MLRELIKSAARHVGSFIAGYLMAKGYIEATDQELVSGAVVGLATIILAFIDKARG